MYDGARVHTTWASATAVVLGAVLWRLGASRDSRSRLRVSDNGNALGTAFSLVATRTEQLPSAYGLPKSDQTDGRLSGGGARQRSPTGPNRARTQLTPVVGFDGTLDVSGEPALEPKPKPSDASQLQPPLGVPLPGQPRRRREGPRAWHFYCWMNALLGWIMLSSGGTMLAFISFKTATYDMLHDELANKWGLDAGVDAPVFVGEFGEGSGYEGVRYWRDMIGFIEQYELDWAYWPINGDVWSEEHQRWDDEWYGILNREYSGVRRPGQLATLQRIQPPP